MTSNLNRRRFLKASAAGAGLLAAPAIISSKALASSGELNFTGWAGYPLFAEKVFPAIEAANGIKMIFSELPDQDTMFGAAKSRWKRAQTPRASAWRRRRTGQPTSRRNWPGC